MATSRSDDGGEGRPAARGPGEVDTVRWHRTEVLQRERVVPWWERRWAAVPPRWRTILAAGGALAVAGGVGLAGLNEVLEQAAGQVVRLETSIGVSSSSSSPPGGHVTYFAVIHNAGSQPVHVTSMQASGNGLALGARSDSPRWLPAGGEIYVPLSVLLTCAGADTDADADGVGLRAEVGVRPVDGTPRPVQAALEPAALVLGVADTMCSLRPELRNYELSGPILRPDARNRVTATEGGAEG